MKNWKKASIGALCVVSLLAGCGTQGGDTNNNDKNADEPKEISLEQVRADNIPEKLLEEHDTVTVSIQGTDQDSKETYTAKVQYTRDDKGNLLLASHYSYTADSPVGEDEFFAQACLSIEGNGVYLSKMESDGRLNMNCYPSGEYERPKGTTCCCWGRRPGAAANCRTTARSRPSTIRASRTAQW